MGTVFGGTAAAGAGAVASANAGTYAAMVKEAKYGLVRFGKVSCPAGEVAAGVLIRATAEQQDAAVARVVVASRHWI